MTRDVTHLVGAADRQVTYRERDGKTATVAVVTRTYSTTVEDLWDALTNPVRIPRWFMPVSGELRLGGRYALTGNASGTITRCDPPNRFEATWEYGGQVSWIEVSLAAAPKGSATLRLEHIAHVPPEFASQYGPGAVGVGWDLGLYGLGQHIDTGAQVADPAAAMVWLGSVEGRAFVAQSSEAWGQAWIASGTDAAAARAAVERTTAFYTPPATDSAAAPASSA